jgi:hypothetical protein
LEKIIEKFKQDRIKNGLSARTVAWPFAHVANGDGGHLATMSEDRGQKTEDRGQRTEDRRQRTEDRG